MESTKRSPRIFKDISESPGSNWSVLMIHESVAEGNKRTSGVTVFQRKSNPQVFTADLTTN